MTDRLILVVAAYFPDSYGGAERQARILAEALGRRGVDVTLVAPTTWAAAPHLQDTAFGRIERFRVRAYPNRGGRHLGDFLRWTLWFRRRFRAADAPIYVFHARLHALGPALAAGRSGAPLLIKLGGGGEASDFAALRAKRLFYGRWVQALLLRRTARFVANGDQIVQDLADLGVEPRRIAAFPNGVELPPAATVAAAIERRTGAQFAFAGRMVTDKRVAVLNDAAVLLAHEARPPRLTFLGDGPEADRLRGAPRSPEAEKAVTFAGFVGDVGAVLMDTDFYVSASLREGQSNALLEAMAAGVVPMVCAASGVADIVEEGVNGWIVPESTPEAFAAAMRKALALPESRRRAMAHAARASVEAKVGIDAVADRTLGLIRSLGGASR